MQTSHHDLHRLLRTLLTPVFEPQQARIQSTLEIHARALQHTTFFPLASIRLVGNCGSSRSNCPCLSPDQVGILTDFLTSTESSLSSLILRHQDLGPKAVIQLATKGLAKNNRLEVLDMAGNPIGAHASNVLARAVAEHPMLTSVSLAQCEIQSEGLEGWSELFWLRRSSLTFLNLSQNHITDAGVDKLALILENNVVPNGFQLQLDKNEITLKGFETLVCAMNTNVTCQLLKLLPHTNSSQDRQCFQSLLNQLELILRRNVHICRVQTLEQLIFQPQLPLIQQPLIRLELTDIDLGTSTSTITRLCQVLKHHLPYLVHLGLDNNGLFPDALSLILETNVESNVESIAVSRNGLNSVHIRQLSRGMNWTNFALRGNDHRTTKAACVFRPQLSAWQYRLKSARHAIHSLSLVNLQLGDVEVGVLFPALAKCTHLRLVNVQSNALTDRIQTILEHFLHTCTNLQHLNLKHNPELHFPTLLPCLQHIVPAHPNLLTFRAGPFSTKVSLDDINNIRNQVCTHKHSTSKLMVLELAQESSCPQMSKVNWMTYQEQQQEWHIQELQRKHAGAYGRQWKADLHAQTKRLRRRWRRRCWIPQYATTFVQKHVIHVALDRVLRQGEMQAQDLESRAVERSNAGSMREMIYIEAMCQTTMMLLLSCVEVSSISYQGRGSRRKIVGTHKVILRS